MKLTDSDRAALDALADKYLTSDIDDAVDGAYRAGMAAMAERCAVVCFEMAAKEYGEAAAGKLDTGNAMSRCAVACRALAKP